MKRGRKPKCPYCGSGSTVHKGHRVTVTIGNRPLAWCKSCKRKFTIGREPDIPNKQPPVAASETI